MRNGVSDRPFVSSRKDAIMSSISSVGSSIYSSAFNSSARGSRTGNSSKMAEDLFAQLDTTGKGYIEKSDLASALSALSSGTSSTSSVSSTSSTSSVSSAVSSDSSASVDDVFAKFDSDSDGKVTESELASGLESLASALDGQFNSMRMNGAMPPPPPPQNDEGFTQDELTQQLSDLSSSSTTDSARSELLSKIVANFDAADTNSDGKVSNAEAMAYEKSTSSSTSSSVTASASSSSESSSSSSSDSSDLAILKRVMDLMQSYASGNSTTASTLSVSA